MCGGYIHHKHTAEIELIGASVASFYSSISLLSCLPISQQLPDDSLAVEANFGRGDTHTTSKHAAEIELIGASMA